MPRLLTALCLLACLALVAAGCGGDNGDSPAATETGAQGETTTETKPGDSTTAKPAEQGSDSDRGASTEGSGGSGTSAEERAEFEAPAGGDDSIQTYGTEVEGEDEEAIVTAMRSFFRAMATADYPAICSGLTSANREGLEQYLKVKKKQGSCETVLEEVLVTAAAPEARRAARGSVYQVRVENDNAFVLFTPAGGVASYFVMKRENGEWKSTGLATGTPFDPTAASSAGR